jgi:hypothetical protein
MTQSYFFFAPPLTLPAHPSVWDKRRMRVTSQCESSACGAVFPGDGPCPVCGGTETSKVHGYRSEDELIEH